MAKLTGRTAGVTLSINDIIHAVDVDDLTDGPLGTSKKWSVQQLKDLITSYVDQFTELNDTPANFTSASLKSVRVNVGETALEFYTPVFGSTTYTGLTDTPANYTSDNSKFLRVNSGATAVEHVAASAIGLSTFNNDAGFLTSIPTHTGEVTGGTGLVVDKTAITNKTTVTAASGDFVLISDTSDTGNLKKANVADFLLAGVSGLNDLTDVTITSAAQGDVLFRNATGWVNLVPGTNGQVLTSGGAAANVTWETAGGGGIYGGSGSLITNTTINQGSNTLVFNSNGLSSEAGMKVFTDNGTSGTVYGLDARAIGSGGSSNTAILSEAYAGGGATNARAGDFTIVNGSTATQNMALKVTNLNTSGTFNFGGHFTSTSTGTAITVPSGGGRVAIGLNFASAELHVNGQVQVDGGLNVVSTTDAIVLPRMTATQASALSVLNGQIIYVTDTNGTFTSAGFWGYEESSWVKL